MVKKLFLLLSTINLLVITAGYAQNESGKFTLKGKIIGQNKGLVRLSYLNEFEKYIKDTVRLKNGRFTITGHISQPTHALLTNITESKNRKTGNAFDLFLVPNTIFVLFTDESLKNAKVSGSIIQEEWDTLNRSKDSLYKKIDTLRIKFTTLTKKYKGAKKRDQKIILSQRINLIKSQIIAYKSKLKKVDYTFIRTHPESFLSPYLLRPRLSDLPVDSLRFLYTNMNESVRSSRYGIFIRNEIRKKEWSKIGAKAQNFVATDIHGNKFMLSNLKGKKCVLIDFWASWCQPCRAEIPNLKKIYNKYHQKGFDIIAISMDKNKEDWVKSIYKDSISEWIHIQESKSILEKYYVNGIPTKYLIDKTGIIIGNWEGYSKENEKSLNEIIKKAFD